MTSTSFDPICLENIYVLDEWISLDSTMLTKDNIDCVSVKQPLTNAISHTLTHCQFVPISVYC